MADTSVLRKGLAIKFENKLCQVMSVFFVSPGKGSAFYKTRLKEISSGKQFENTFKSGENLELVDMERKNASFLYRDGSKLFFMENDTYEQHELEEEEIDAGLIKFLTEEAKVILLFVEDNFVSMSFVKSKMAFKVTDAPPAIKGDTVSNVYRAVTIETGAAVQAPLFIKTGDVIIVNVETGEYAERQK